LHPSLTSLFFNFAGSGRKKSQNCSLKFPHEIKSPRKKFFLKRWTAGFFRIRIIPARKKKRF